MSCQSCHPLVAPVTPPVVAGSIAEQAQYQRARAAFTTALVGRPVLNLRLNGAAGRTAWIDARSPQHFVSHPAIRQAVEETAVGIETAAPHLPGLQPLAGWDGEAGATAPTAGML